MWLTNKETGGKFNTDWARTKAFKSDREIVKTTIKDQYFYEDEHSITFRFDNAENLIPHVVNVLGHFENEFENYGKLIEGIDFKSDDQSIPHALARTEIDYFGESISINLSKKLNDDNVLREINTMRKGWNHNNSSCESIIAHELSHAMLTKIAVVKRYSDNSIFSENEVEQNLCKSIINDAFYQTNYSARDICDYATTNPSETIAEAFGDVFSNGKNASEASKLVYGKAKEYINKYSSRL